MKTAAEPPKIAEAKCNQRRMVRPEESTPPTYSLHLANIVAAEKQANANAIPTKVVTKILEGKRKRVVTKRLATINRATLCLPRKQE